MTASISANALAVWPLPWSAAARVIVASRRSASGVAGLSISAVQLSISFAGAASVSGAQMTGGSAAVWALAALKVKMVMASAALTAKGEAKDRMIGPGNMAVLNGNAASLCRPNFAQGSKAGQPGPRDSTRKRRIGCDLIPSLYL